MSREVPRKIQVLARHPHWMPERPGGWDLQFLSWGARRFGREPVSVAMHEGWVYIAVTSGAPLAVVGGRPRRCPAPRVMIFDPDCAYGWTDGAGGRCSVLCWVWSSPPAVGSLRPAPGGCRSVRVDRDVLRALARLHAECVEAVAEPDALAPLILRRARLDLDILLLRAAGRAGRADAAARFDLAVRYLDHHPAQLEPVAGLCEYLRVSPATLKALFRARAGVSPRTFALRRRMDRARARLAAGASVKETAAELGYRHANDFSRAFARFHGRTVRAWQDRK